MSSAVDDALLANVALDDAPTEPTTLLSLDEDLLLAILQHCASARTTKKKTTSGAPRCIGARTLCRVERTCRLFSQPTISLHADGLPLSLPERAAEAALAAGQAEGQLRAYTKGANESFKRALRLREQGLLALGVLHDVPYNSIRKDANWKLAFSQRYTHRTSDKDLEKIPTDARYVLLGAVNMAGATSTSRYHNGHTIITGMPSRNDLISGKALVFSLLAWGTREAVLRTTHDENEFRGGTTTT